MLDKLNIKYGYWLLIILAIEIILIVSFLYEPLTKLTPLPYTFRELQLAKSSPQKIFSENLTTLNNQKTKTISSYEKHLMDSGLVNVKDVVIGISVLLKYSTKDNFTGKDLYGDLNECYLQKDVAEKLAKAQNLLHEKFPFYNIVIFDGVRPMSIQKMMWDSLQMPDSLKWRYVSPPTYGSLHNYGAAVDVSLVNEDNWLVDMGTDYDFFGELGYPSAENRMVQQGKLSYRQMENRKLLRDVMLQAGFMMIDTEWWHFNSCSLNEARTKYRIVQ